MEVPEVIKDSAVYEAYDVDVSIKTHIINRINVGYYKGKTQSYQISNYFFFLIIFISVLYY